MKPKKYLKKNKLSTLSKKIKNFDTLKKLEYECQRFPNSLNKWKDLAAFHLKNYDFELAKPAVKFAFEIEPEDPATLSMIAAIKYNDGEIREAVEILEKAQAHSPDCVQVAHDLATILFRTNNFSKCLLVLDKALKSGLENKSLQHIRANALKSMYKYSDGLKILLSLSRLYPNEYRYLIDIGNIQRDIGMLDDALKTYEHAMKLAGKSSAAYSNFLTSLHYSPSIKREQLREVCCVYSKKYAPNQIEFDFNHVSKTKNKKIRVGLLSDGLRKHPVGSMITSAIELFPKTNAEFVVFSSTDTCDDMTIRISKNIREWYYITQVYGKELYDLILSKKIDILFELSGHNSGSRMDVICMKPAPIIIKWVGGLINTTGINQVDYLLSDKYETPEGVDDFYTEKLIRMPDDYVCYVPPDYAPEVSDLPYINNKYITFGCFNNATKINDVLLEKWSEILKKVPESRLFLKSTHYSSDDLKNIVTKKLNDLGIMADKLIFSGPSSHKSHLEAYREVDIALDTWPYSGGLTTCEALLMGVPVVTLPGPSFAGRHSATHLINAGLPELVTEDWCDYEKRVLELAFDINSLSIIRSHLRSMLLKSPLCDAVKFSNNLNNALRAVWQRYCEGKKPEALLLKSEDLVVFADNNTPVELHHPNRNINSKFKWKFEGKIVVIDHGVQSLLNKNMFKIIESEIVELIVFDPLSVYSKNPLILSQNVHYYANNVLGDGSSESLYICKNDDFSGTLKPLDVSDILEEKQLKSISLDNLSQLSVVDWLLLDDLNDNNKILMNSKNVLDNVLILHVKLRFQSTHVDQVKIDDLYQFAKKHGLDFYCFHNQINSPDTVYDIGSRQILSADAIFIPTDSRLKDLSDNDRRKLAFIAFSYYNLDCLAIKSLSLNSNSEALLFKETISSDKDKDSYMNNDFICNNNLSVIKSEQLNIPIEKPQLTLPKEVSLHLEKIYRNSDTILEYGSGGSTILASEMNDKTIFSVENDLNWSNKMKHYISQEKLISPAIIHFVDIGSTGPWARPLTDTNWRDFHKYPLSVWDREDFIDPDVVLIDGRFRVACFITTFIKISKPTIVLFDDYVDREYYHTVERLAKPVKFIGRMAHFELFPKPFPIDELSWIFSSFNKVTYSNNKRI